jgi:hypothetical protein
MIQKMSELDACVFQGFAACVNASTILPYHYSVGVVVAPQKRKQ